MPALNRRSFLCSATATALVGFSRGVPRVAAGTDGYLGEPIQAIAALLSGQGPYTIENSSDRTISLVHRDPNATPTTPLIFIQGDLEGRTEFVEIDGSFLPDGFPNPEDPSWRTRALPSDAVTLANGSSYAPGSTAIQFVIEVFSSESLRQRSGRSGNGVYAWQTLPAFSARPQQVRRLHIATEADQPYDIVPTGSTAGLLANGDAWQQAFGAPGVHQSGFGWEVAPGAFVSTPNRGPVEAISEGFSNTTISLETVIKRLTGFLPDDAVLEQTFLLYPTPTGPGCVRIQRWHLPTASRDCLVTIIFSGDEASGVVSAYSLVAI